MTCNQCGNSNPNGAVFCAGCGGNLQWLTINEVNNISSPVPAEEEAEAAAPPLPLPPSPPPLQPYSQPPPPLPAAETAMSIPKVILSVLLCILLFAFSAAAAALLIVNPSNIAAAIPQVDAIWILDELDLREELERELRRTHLNRADVSDLNRFLSRSNVSGEIEKILDGYFTAIVENDLNYYVSARDIMNSVRAISPDIHEEFNYRLTNADFDSLGRALDNNVNLRAYSAGSLMEEAGIDFAIPFILLSAYPAIILFVLCFAVLFNLFLVNRKRIRGFFLCSGISGMVLGLVYLAAGLIFGPLSRLFAADLVHMVSRVAAGFIPPVILAGLTCLGAGIILVVVYFVIRKIRKNYAPKMTAVAVNNGVMWNMLGIMGNVAVLIALSVVAILFISNLP